MKFAAILTLLSLITTLSPVYANELTDSDLDSLNYCNEQAELAGFDNAKEKSEYIDDCMNSFSTPPADSQSQD